MSYPGPLFRAPSLLSVPPPRRRLTAIFAALAWSATLALGSVQPAAATSVFLGPPRILQVSAGPSFTQVEGGGAQLRTLAVITDPGHTASLYTANVNWGDGSSNDTCTSATTSCYISDTGGGTFTVYSTGHTYADEGSYQVLVSVSGSDNSTGDTALGRQADQSGYYDIVNHPATLAIDSDTNGDFGHGSVAHTNNDYQPWWQVDLGAQVPISSIVLWNRTDCCGYRVSNFYVLASSAPLPRDLMSGVNQVCGTSVSFGTSCPGAQFQNPSPNPYSTFNMNVTARYVRLQLGGCCEPINFAEMQVNGPVYLTASVTGPNVSATPVTLNAVEGVSTGTQTLGTFTLNGDPAEVLASTVDWGDGVSSGGTLGFDGVSTYTVSGSHTFGPGSYATVVRRDNPAAYWRLGGSTPYVDTAGSPNTLTAAGVTSDASGATADGDGAAALDGVHSLSANPSAFPGGLLGGGQRTMETWYRSTQTGYATLAGYGCSQFNQAFSISINPLNSPSLGFWMYGNDAAFPAPNARDGNWHHVALVYDGNRTTLYLDGAALGSKVVGGLNTGACAAQFGRDFVNGNVLTGSLDEVALYSAVLSPAQIAAHFAARTLHGQFPVTIRISADGGPATTFSTVANVTDVALSVTGAPGWTASAGTATGPITVGSISRAAAPGTFAGTMSAVIDWGDGSASGGTVTGTGPYSVAGNHTYSSGGLMNIRITAADGLGAVTIGSYSNRVRDYPLTGGTQLPSGPVSVRLGAPSQPFFIAGFSDQDPNPNVGDFSWSLSWGDGSSSSQCASECSFGGPMGPFQYTLQTTRSFPRTGRYTYTISIHDRAGSGYFGQGVVNVLPALLTLYMQTLAINTNAGEPMSLVNGIAGNFTDPDGDGPTSYKATIVWGDGTSSPGSIRASQSPTECTSGAQSCMVATGPSHTYATPGTYVLRLNVTDIDGSTASNQTRVNVGNSQPA